MVTSEQLRAARALLRWEQKDIAAASKVSLPTIKRLETIRGDLAAQVRTVGAIRTALEKAGVEFIPEDDGGPGVRLRKAKRKAKRRGP
jgi:transcriptional regulator with XRE-family HTH domain